MCTAAGDLYYQPPESMFKGMISPAMDIWAVGVTIYETITGGISGVTLKHHLQRVKSGFQADLPAGAPPRLQVCCCCACMSLVASCIGSCDDGKGEKPGAINIPRTSPSVTFLSLD